MALQDRRPSFSDGAPFGEGVKPDAEVEEIENEDVEEVDDVPDVLLPDESEGEETPSVPAENNAPDDASQDDTVVAEDAVEPDPVEPQKNFESVDSLEVKRATLLKQIQDLRAERRELKGSPFQKEETPRAPLMVEEDPLKDVNQEDRSLIDRVVAARLKAEGYVRKDEIQAMSMHERIQSATETWVRENPEFSKENDPDDEKWNLVHSYVSRMFNRPSKVEDVREMLDIARERLFGKKTAPLPQKSINSVAAKKEKLAAGAKSGAGGGVGSVRSSEKKTEQGKIDPSLAGYLQGFTKEELNDLGIS